MAGNKVHFLSAINNSDITKMKCAIHLRKPGNMNKAFVK